MLVPTKQKYGLLRRPAKANLLFLHVPKCGGSFVEQAFLPWIRKCPSRRIPDARGHLTYREYKRVFARHHVDLSALRIFTVVRNPWDWHVSWFHYLKQDKDRGRSGMSTEVDLFQAFDFKDYLAWLADDDAPTSPTRYIRKQLVDYLCNEAGQLAVDRVLRQERLDEDLGGMVEEFELAAEVPSQRANPSAHADYRSYYDDAGIELVARRHADDIARFGYTF
jgi:hypothetical protein